MEETLPYVPGTPITKENSGVSECDTLTGDVNEPLLTESQIIARNPQLDELDGFLTSSSEMIESAERFITLTSEGGSDSHASSKKIVTRPCYLPQNSTCGVRDSSSGESGSLYTGIVHTDADQRNGHNSVRPNYGAMNGGGQQGSGSTDVSNAMYNPVQGRSRTGTLISQGSSIEMVISRWRFYKEGMYNQQFLDTPVGYCACLCFPVNTKHLYNICTMLDQCRRRWANIVQMLCKCFVFAAFLSSVIHFDILNNAVVKL